MGLSNLLVSLLQKERKIYALPFENNVEGIFQVIQPGDVVLVEGNTYMSEIIKILTRSTWSHCFLYIGDKEIIESDTASYENGKLVKLKQPKVMKNPVEKYFSYNIRIKRPVQITQEDLDAVIKSAKDHVGREYDRKNILNFIYKYMGLKKFDLSANIGESDKYICSGLVAKVFQEVNYPVLPSIALVRNKKTTVKRRNFTQFSPGDFDKASSQFWQTIQFQFVGKTEFYKDIEWD